LRGLPRLQLQHAAPERMALDLATELHEGRAPRSEIGRGRASRQFPPRQRCIFHEAVLDEILDELVSELARLPQSALQRAPADAGFVRDLIEGEVATPVRPVFVKLLKAGWDGKVAA
jgi:hypothetical protein